MQEDKCAERLLNIKAKIASIREMDPSLRCSIEEIEERKKNMPIYRTSIIPSRSENRASHLLAEPIRPVNSSRKVLTFDSSYYKDLLQKFDRSPLANINAPRNEAFSPQEMKEPEVSQEDKKEEGNEGKEGKEETGRVTSNINQPASLFKLQPVIQESTIPEPQIEPQATKPVHQFQTAQMREAEPQAKSPVREFKDSKQKEGSLFNATNKQEQIKPLSKPLAEPPKFNFFNNPPPNSLLFKVPDTASQPLFSIDKDKKLDVKPLGLFSQKIQPVSLSQVKGDIIKQPQNVPKPPNSTFFKMPSPSFSLPSLNQSSKQPFPSFMQSNSQKVTFPLSQQAPTTKQPLQLIGNSNLFGKEQEKQPQATQPQQKNGRIFQGLFTSSQQVASTTAPLNTNEAQKPNPLTFNSCQRPSQTFLGGNNPPAPTNNGLSLFTVPKPTLGLFSSNSSNEKPASESKPPTFTPNFSTAKIEPVASSEIKKEGSFQKKTTFGELPATPAPQGGLFTNSNPNNPLKEQPKPASPQNNHFSLVQNKKTAVPIQQGPEKAPEKQEKKEKGGSFLVIGPGGKKLEMPIFSPGNNLFGSTGLTEVKNIFSQPSPAPSLFPNLPNKIFQSSGAPDVSSQPQPSGQTGNIFGQTNMFANTLFNFNQPKNTYGPGDSDLFGKAGEKDVESGDEGAQDEGPEEAEDTANPSLSTGKFDYVKTQVHFKEGAVKFKEFKDVKDNDVIENITVSIQSFENSQDRYLYIRLANKCIAFTGMFLKDKTSTRPLNNTEKNVEVKIVKMKDGLPCGFAILRIQFKEDSVGAKFLKEANAVNTTA